MITSTSSSSIKYLHERVSPQVKLSSNDYYAKEEYKYPGVIQNEPEQRENELKVTTLKLPSRVIIRSGSSSTIHHGLHEEDKVQVQIRVFKQKVLKEMEDQQSLITSLQNKIYSLQKQMSEKQEEIQNLKNHLNSKGSVFKLPQQRFPELDYLKTQCRQINKKIKVIVNDSETRSFKAIEQKVEKVIGDLLQILIIKISKLKKNSINIEKSIQDIQKSIKDLTNQFISTFSENKLTKSEVRLEQYHRITHQFLNLLLKLQQYPNQLAELQNKIQSIESISRKDISSPRSSSLHTRHKKQNSHDRLQQLRNTLIKMRGTRGLDKIKVDPNGLVKFFDTDTYIFDGDGSFFKLSPEELKQLEKIKLQN